MPKPISKTLRPRGQAGKRLRRRGFFRRWKWVWIGLLVLLLIPAVQVGVVRKGGGTHAMKKVTSDM
jgi:hypothetical protein